MNARDMDKFLFEQDLRQAAQRDRELTALQAQTQRESARLAQEYMRLTDSPFASCSRDPFSSPLLRLRDPHLRDPHFWLRDPFVKPAYGDLAEAIAYSFLSGGIYSVSGRMYTPRFRSLLTHLT